MKYPFEFKELLITKYLLDTLGFSEYYSGCADFGYRSLDLPFFEKVYRIIEYDELKEDGASMGGMDNSYVSSYWASYSNEIPERKLYFLHDMYNDILIHLGAGFLEQFIKVCKKVNMYPFIISYERYLSEQNSLK